MKRIILILAFLLMADSRVWAKDYYVAEDGLAPNDGLAPATAWTTLETAIETNARTGNDIVWVRRNTYNVLASAIACNGAGTAEKPIKVIGWPRPALTINGTDWQIGTSGFQVASGVTDSWIGRDVVDPSGVTYFVTYIHSGVTVCIDRPWAGTSAYMNTACKLVADEHYTVRPQAGIDALWDADEYIGFPVIDSNNGAFGVKVEDADRFWGFYNLAFRNSTAVTYGCIGFSSCGAGILSGCSILQQSNQLAFGMNDVYLVVSHIVIQGDRAAADTSQNLMYVSGGNIKADTMAIYGGYRSIVLTYSAIVSLANVNLGVEETEQNANIGLYYLYALSGYDVILGSVPAILTYNASAPGASSKISIENYGKRLGAHRTFNLQGIVDKVDAGQVFDYQRPSQRASGAASLIEGTYNLATTTSQLPKPADEFTPVIFTHEFDVDTSSKTYRYYLGDNLGGNLGTSGIGVTAGTSLFTLDATYVKAYGSGVTYYVQDTLTAVTPFGGTTNWSNYVEIGPIAPATASKVRITGKCNVYSATKRFWVDPKPYIY